MNRTLTIASAALALLLGAGVSTAAANNSGTAHRAAHARHHAAHHNHVHAHRHLHGVRHSYHRHYTGWTRYAWLPNQRAYGYYSPNRGWYYWYARSNSFVPIAFLGTYVPVPVNGVVITASSSTDVSAPELPPGAVSLPAGVTPPLPE